MIKISVESLKNLKVYIGKQYKDIPTFEFESDEVKDARIDELQCLETYLNFLIAKETDTLDEYYDNMFATETN